MYSLQNRQMGRQIARQMCNQICCQMQPEQTSTQADGLLNACKMPGKRWRRALVLFVFGVLRGRALWERGGMWWGGLVHPVALPPAAAGAAILVDIDDCLPSNAKKYKLNT